MMGALALFVVAAGLLVLRILLDNTVYKLCPFTGIDILLEIIVVIREKIVC